MTDGITVLMPVYNAEIHLREAINSILKQTFTRFEFLIIDDASTDTSVDIIKSYNDPRIRLVQNEKNMGVMQTLNKGIELAAYELIARMDADDISHPDRLQKQYDYLQANPDCALLSTWASEFITGEEAFLVERIKPDYYYYNLTFECWIYHPSVVYKKSAVIDVGKYASPYAQDYNLWWRISRKYKIAVLPEVLLDYRSSNSSISRITKKKETEDAHKEQLLSNIAHFTGTDFKLVFDEIEFLRSNVEPFVDGKSIGSLVRCFKKLKYISTCIEQKENINNTNNVVRKGANYKINRTINFLKTYYSKKQIFIILLRAHYWYQLLAFTKKELLKTLYSFRSPTTNQKEHKYKLS